MSYIDLGLVGLTGRFCPFWVHVPGLASGGWEGPCEDQGGNAADKCGMVSNTKALHPGQKWIEAGRNKGRRMEFSFLTGT